MEIELIPGQLTADYDVPQFMDCMESQINLWLFKTMQLYHVLYATVCGLLQYVVPCSMWYLISHLIETCPFKERLYLPQIFMESSNLGFFYQTEIIIFLPFHCTC